MCRPSPPGRSPQDRTPHLQHEPVPGLGDTLVFPLVVIGWGAVVLIPHQHLLQEEVGCELQGQEGHRGVSAPAPWEVQVFFVEPVALHTEHSLGGKLSSESLSSFGWGCFGFPYKKKSRYDWGREVV